MKSKYSYPIVCECACAPMNVKVTGARVCVCVRACVLAVHALTTWKRKGISHCYGGSGRGSGLGGGVNCYKLCASQMTATAATSKAATLSLK